MALGGPLAVDEIASNLTLGRAGQALWRARLRRDGSPAPPVPVSGPVLTRQERHARGDPSGLRPPRTRTSLRDRYAALDRLRAGQPAQTPGAGDGPARPTPHHLLREPMEGPMTTTPAELC